MKILRTRVFWEGYVSESDATNALSVRNVVKQFGSGPNAVTALNNVSVDIQSNEFFTLLGPSGCGKTTLLRLTAGFEQPTAGEIFLFGEEIEDLPPHERPVNTVFQHYALFPHMTVEENIGFGLRMQKWSGPEIRARVNETLALVKMEQFATRKPVQLSGGQQQRIALARALAPRPKVLLLDEPLSALDLKLRQAMRNELKTLQRETGITFIFVTHDQEEALTMSDRIAVMSAGLIQQIGAPLEIYERPINRFVADFIGDTNFIETRIDQVSGNRALCVAGGELQFETDVVDGHGIGDAVTLAVRPERITLQKTMLRSKDMPVIEEATYLGTDTSYEINIGDGVVVTVRDQNAEAGMGRFAAGENVKLTFSDGAARMLVD
ncbi:MAG: ABC transporter ATP-binding protein [Alphaproteobacteria bacterium]|nr:ABC transporter ATP-binding protein [Alphaproteobacteria bacterium]